MTSPLDVQLQYVGARAIITTPSYRFEVRDLEAPFDRAPYARLFGLDSKQWMDINLLSSADTTAAPDETWAIESVNVDREPSGDIRIRVACRSTVWKYRETRLLCAPDRIEVRLFVEGDGDLTDVTLFGGRASLPNGACGTFRSEIGFAGVLSPVAAEPVQLVRPAGSPVVLGVIGDADPGRLHAIFSPPPLVLGLSRSLPEFATEVPGGDWLGLALRAPVHELTFTEFRYDPLDDGFLITLDYEGHTRVGGRWESPVFVLRPAGSGWSTLEDYRQDLIDTGAAPPEGPEVSEWWREPIFCGWGAQCARAVHLLHAGDTDPANDTAASDKANDPANDAAANDNAYDPANHAGGNDPANDPGNDTGANGTANDPTIDTLPETLEEERIVSRIAPTLAREDVYDDLLERMAAHGLRAGTVVIDDRWQAEYGTATVDESHWPNLRAWIAKRHDAGQKVLLWWKAWDPAGIPAEECVVDAAGRPVTVDPGNPAYLSRLREIVATLLSPSVLDADGVKVDFTQRGPSGRTLRGTQGVWGIAALHALLAELYRAAQAAKPDALVVCHAVHPSFADACNMVRLNDVSKFDVHGERVPVVDQLRMRHEIVRRILPAHLIDTDQWPMPNRAEWLRYADAQIELGVPALYYLESIDRSGEHISSDDLAKVAASWDRYRKSLSR